MRPISECGRLWRTAVLIALRLSPFVRRLSLGQSRTEKRGSTSSGDIIGRSRPSEKESFLRGRRLSMIATTTSWASTPEG
jgi:hypothetical protein